MSTEIGTDQPVVDVAAGSAAAAAGEVAAGAERTPAGTRPNRGRTRGWLLRRPRRVVALVIGALLVLGWLAYASPVTLVKHVVVTAPRGISEESLRLASGI